MSKFTDIVQAFKDRNLTTIGNFSISADDIQYQSAIRIRYGICFRVVDNGVEYIVLRGWDPSKRTDETRTLKALKAAFPCAYVCGLGHPLEIVLGTYGYRHAGWRVTQFNVLDRIRIAPPRYYDEVPI